MKMVSMKMSDAEKKDTMEVKPAGISQSYPWGLSINLNEDSMAKLGVDLPKVGEELMLHAMVKVTDSHMSETEGGKKNVSCALQITDMALMGMEKGPEDRLYKK